MKPGYFFLIAILTLISMTQLFSQMSTAIYVSDAGNFDQPPWQILKFDENGENGSVFINHHLDWPQDILFLEKDTVVLISNLNNGTITRFHANTGDYINEFATGIGNPTRMKIGADSLLYVLQWQGNGKVWRYGLDGSFVDEFTSTGVNSSIGLDWDQHGNLYVSSYYDATVTKFSPTGEDLGLFINSNLLGPTNIWFNDAGDLLINDYNAGNIKRFDSTGVYKGVFISNVPQCEGVDFMNNGNILIGVGGTKSVREYSSSGAFVRGVVSPGALNLLLPNAVFIRRTAMTSSVQRQPIYTDANLVTPNIGSVFHINRDLTAGNTHSISVIDAIGGFKSYIATDELNTWHSDSLADGVYFLLMSLPDGKIARQEIIIQH